MKTGCLLIVLLSFGIACGQTYEELALMYSRPGVAGTARTIGSAGAYGSVGADLGSVTINPAGIGLYRSTDFSVTPGLMIGMNETQFNGSVSNSSFPRVYLNQAGAVFTKVLKNAARKNDISFTPNRLQTFSFAINYQRQTMFNRKQVFDGFNGVNSGISSQADHLNNTTSPISTDYYPTEIILAYNTDLIVYDSFSNTFLSRVQAPVRQSGNMTTRGGIDQLDFTFGGNVSDKFYFGAGLGVSFLSFQRNSWFSEVDEDNNSPGFTDYTFSSSLRERGVGVNTKFGVIYRPITWARFGLAYQIPTYYTMTENYFVNMTTYYDTFYYSVDAEQIPLKYKMRSPMKGVASASFFFKENGFFSVDYELLNYGASRYNFGDAYKDLSDEVNANSKQNNTIGHVIRAGIEGAHKWFRIRGGYAFATTPYKKDVVLAGYAEAKHNASFGLGYRGKSFYVDLAYLFGITKDANYPYADWELKNTNINHNVFLTLGWKVNKDLGRGFKSDTPPPQDF